MKITFVKNDGGEFSIRKLITVEDDKIGGSIDYNGTIASTKPNEKGYGLSYYWHLPFTCNLLSAHQEVKG
jgi:hypothetical protein